MHRTVLALALMTAALLAVNVLEAAYAEASAGSIAESAAAIDAAILGVKTQAAVVDLAVKPSCP